MFDTRILGRCRTNGQGHAQKEERYENWGIGELNGAVDLRGGFLMDWSSGVVTSLHIRASLTNTSPSAWLKTEEGC